MPCLLFADRDPRVCVVKPSPVAPVSRSQSQRQIALRLGNSDRAVHATHCYPGSPRRSIPRSSRRKSRDLRHDGFAIARASGLGWPHRMEYPEEDTLNIYTDGSSLPKPRRGGLGVLFILMNPRAIFLPVVLLALAVVLSLSAARAPVAAAQPLVTGIAAVDSDPLAFQRVEEAGSRFVHNWVNWSSVAPKGEPSHWQPDNPADPSYNWTAIDLWVTWAVQAGLTPVLGIQGVPFWAQRCKAEGGPYNAPCDPDPTVLAAFATAAAQKFPLAISL